MFLESTAPPKATTGRATSAATSLQGSTTDPSNIKETRCVWQHLYFNSCLSIQFSLLKIHILSFPIVAVGVGRNPPSPPEAVKSKPAIAKKPQTKVFVNFKKLLKYRGSKKLWIIYFQVYNNYTGGCEVPPHRQPNPPVQPRIFFQTLGVLCEFYHFSRKSRIRHWNRN